jgi:hypothetical protein
VGRKNEDALIAVVLVEMERRDSRVACRSIDVLASDAMLPVFVVLRRSRETDCAKSSSCGWKSHEVRALGFHWSTSDWVRWERSTPVRSDSTTAQ